MSAGPARDADRLPFAAGDRRRLIERGREVLRVEAAGVAAAAGALGDAFADALDLLARASGRIVVSGVGKSGLVARKLAATFTSTGSPSLFVHPVDALHGDLGILGPGDVAILISVSGETEELSRVAPLLAEREVPIVLLTGRPESTLARIADVVVELGDAPEASAVKLVPTTSSTVSLALGDALAVVLAEERGFHEGEFARLHPGGAIGRRLNLVVGDVMHTGARVPRVGTEVSMKEALVEIVRGRLGVTAVVDGEDRLIGVVTDGDLKRILLRREDILDAPVAEVMTRTPKTIDRGATLLSALERMENNPGGAITSLFVVDDAGRPEGVIHIHDCLKP